MERGGRYRIEAGFILYKCRGSLNVKLTHETTLEFSGEDRIGVRGDCVACINGRQVYKSDWCIGGVTCIRLLITPPPWSSGEDILSFSIKCKASCKAVGNTLVLRRSSHCDDRTLASKCGICAACLPVEVRKLLSNPYTIIYLVATCARRPEQPNTSIFEGRNRERVLVEGSCNAGN